jgi:IS66 C-terminal element/Transposase IS66 family
MKRCQIRQRRHLAATSDRSCSVALKDLHVPHPEPAERVVDRAPLLDDGRIENETSVVERAIRPIALNRKNVLFAGSDQGGVYWGVIASLIGTCKLNAINPRAYLVDVLSRLVNRHSPARSTSSCPWAHADP